MDPIETRIYWLFKAVYLVGRWFFAKPTIELTESKDFYDWVSIHPCKELHVTTASGVTTHRWLEKITWKKWVIRKGKRRTPYLLVSALTKDRRWICLCEPKEIPADSTLLELARHFEAGVNKLHPETEPVELHVTNARGEEVLDRPVEPSAPNVLRMKLHERRERPMESLGLEVVRRRDGE